MSELGDLRLRTERLVLRLPTNDEVVGLARVAEAGIHPPDEMPFLVPWTDGLGKPGFLESFVAYHEEQRRSWQPNGWALQLGVWADGELVGSQGIEATEFAVRCEVATGSWLGRAFQRRGYGTEMRAAVLALAFDGLGANAAWSGALEGNVASMRVSEKLGYELTGEAIVRPRGEPVRERRLLLTREAWRAQRRPPVTIEGLEECRSLFGA